MDRILDSERLAHVGRELRKELSSSNELAGDWVRRAAQALVEQMLAAEVDETLVRNSRIAPCVRQTRTMTYEKSAAAKMFLSLFQLEITRGAQVSSDFCVKRASAPNR